MSNFNDEYLKLRKKRLEEEQKNKQNAPFVFESGPYQNATLTANDIAPVKTQNTVVIDDARDIGKKNTGSGLFKAGAFADGYQFGDVAKVILGTAGDVASGLVQGVAGIGEGLGDLAMYGVAGVQDLLGYDDDAERLREATKEDVIAPLFDSLREKTNIDDTSLLGDFGYGVAQGVGQVGAIIATAGLGGSPLSMGMIGASSMGSGMSEAYKGGATDEEALAYGAMSGLIDVGTEMIFGGVGKAVNAIGISKGLTSIDDVFAKKLSSKMSSQFFKNATEYGVKATAEGLEEVLAGYLSAVAKNLTYMSDEDLEKLVEDENLLEQFAAGALVSGIAQSGDLVKSTKQGRDFITNFSANEEKVIEKEVENRVAEAEQDGTKLTKKEKNEIYEQVQNDIKKGYISTETIESVLGGETYEKYKEAADRDTKLNEEYEALNKEYEELYKMKNGEKSDEQIDRQSDLKNKLAELKEKIDNSDLTDIKSNLFLEVFDSLTQKDKDGKIIRSDRYLKESFYEVSRRSEAFEADLSKYNDKTAETVKRAIDSGILNNTRRTHEFVDMVAKISADKGVLFDFTNNKKLKDSGFAVDGASVNGYVTKDGITVNISSSKAMNTIVGHEISHVLEGTELYAEMQSALFEYAKSKNDYDSRRKSLEELYKNVEGVDYSAELTADLVGEYLFTDEDFINNLSTKHRNVFQKIYDEIKYLLKVATAGSKEARELEKVKRAFNKAYRANGKTSEGTKYSLSDSDGKQLTKEQSEYFKDSKMRDENGNLKVMYHGSQDAGFHVFDANMSDDDTSFFFVDRNDVAASYSGTTETYEAQTIRTAEDMNNFIESIGVEGYEVVEKDGKFTLLYEGDRIADSNTAKGIYEEFCWYEGVGEGDANYKVYLNLKNPLEVDAEGRNWNNISREFSQEVYGRYKSLTAEEKAALSNLAEWGEYSIFKDEMLDARAAAEQGVSSGYGDVAFTKTLARAYEKLGGANANLYDAFSIAQENFSEESLKEFAVKQMNTRDYARKAKAEGYDGVIFKNIHDNGGYSNGSEGASTVAIAFESNQIKSVANEKPTSNPDIRFSLSKPIEETKDLVALHNVRSDKLLEAFRLGGLPSPSVAITKSDILHDNYGEITLLLRKDAIDPQADGRNKVYGSDAWTPTSSNARTEYEVDYEKMRAFEKKLAELGKKVANGAFSNESLVRRLGVEDVSDQNAARLAERLANFDEVRAAYLAEIGQTLEPEYKTKVYNKHGNEALQKFIDKVGVQHLASLAAESKLGNTVAIRAEEEKVRKIIRDTYAEKHANFLNRKPEIKENRIDAYMQKNVSFFTIEDFVNDAWQFYQEGGAVTEEVDRLATSDKVRSAVNDADVRAWLEPQIAEFLGEAGIYNGKDLFTADGRSRSFAETHYTYTAENIVKAMQNASARGEGTFGANANSIIATATPSYNSIDEMHADKGRLKVEEAATYEKILQNIEDSLTSIEHDIMRTTKHHADNTYDEEQIIGSIITEAATGTRTVTGVQRAFAKEGYRISTAQAERILSLYNEAASVPTGYFEAKPERVVGFDEVGVFVIPRNADVKLKQELLNRGYAIAEYDPDVEGDRQKVVNSFEEYKFSLSNVNETPKRYGNYNIFGEDIRLEAPTQEDIAPVDETVDETVTETEAQTEVKAEAPESEVVAEKAIPTENVAPMPSDPTIYDLEQKQAELEDIIRKAMDNKDPNAPKLIDEYNELIDSIAKRKKEESAIERERLASLDDADIPPEMEAPYYDESANIAPENPFEERDIKAVGNRKVKAYMYENPEVKPFFQEEANILLGELQEGTKGERFYTEVEGGVPGTYGSDSYGVWSGTKRHVSADIEYLLDELHYSYADIEKGINAIIEDNGKENNAASKRIEFILNDRLLKGYIDFRNGYDIPPNQDYINLLNEKQITEYSEEARAKFFEEADQYAPPMEDIAPMAENTTVNEPKINKPIEEAPIVENAKKAEIPPTFDTHKKTQIEGQQTIFKESETSTKEQPIKTIKDRLQHKLNASYGELSHNKRLRREALEDYDNQIEALQFEYDNKTNKATKVANDILRRIERLKRLRAEVDADWTKRINDNREKVEKYKAKVDEGFDEATSREMRSDIHAKKVDNIKAKFTDKGLDLDETLKNAKNLSTIATVDNTPQRVMEKALGYKAGQILADETVNKVAQNESEGIKWLNSFTDRKNGVLAKLSKKYNIKPGSKESAAAQMYAEGFYVDENENIVKYGDTELAIDFPDKAVQKNIKGLAHDPIIRQIYDETLNAINESRARNAYPEIQKLDNYFLHFRAMDDTFSRLGLPFNPKDIRAKDLPTDLNGVTADLKPGQPYFASAKHRKGKRTSFDLLGGLETYLTGAKNQIYHIDDIQTLRALRNYVADTYGQANGLEGLDALTEEEAQERIKQVYNSHLSTFAKFLNEEANVLAGKTALIDRGVEGIIGRRGITFLDTINKQVGANMVGFNVSSSLTNFLSGVQAIAKTNKLSCVKSFAQTTSSKISSLFGKTDSFVENNPTIIRRKGADKFYRTPFQKVADSGYVLMSAVDNVTTEFIVRAKYDEFIKKGMSEEQAIVEADKWTSRLMGDRSLGQMPHLYNSKMLGLVTKFQLEVRNQLDSQFYDTIQETKASNEDIKNGLARNAKTAAKVTATLFELAVLQHLFGKAFESVAGYNPAFDIIDVLMKTLGLDDDEEDEDTALDNVEEGFLALLEDLPYTSTLTGGRIPISSALPITELIKGEDEYGNEKSRLETLGEIAPYYISPTGYGQYKKTKQGLSMFDEDLPISGSYTDKGGLRFPIEDTPQNRIQAGVFGQWASENARDYFDNERAPLKEKQIQEFIDSDMPIRDYWDYREGLSEHSKLSEKADYIMSLDLPISTKNLLINNIANREDDIDLTDYDEYGNFEEFDFATNSRELYDFLEKNDISFEKYMSSNEETKKAYGWAAKNPEKFTVSKAVASDVVTYRKYASELYDIKADKDKYGKSISGSRKEKVIDYVNNLDIDYGARLILFKSEYKADDTYNYDIIDYLNNRQDISYEEMEIILKELGFTVLSDGRIFWD